MKRYAGVMIGIIVSAVSLIGCCGPCKLMTVFNKCPHEKPYVVYGRVLDLQCSPVQNCKVVLIKRKYNVPALSADKKAALALGEHHVACTDKTGDYSFCFEPLEANDVWLYFDARDQGYVPQYVELNHLMGPTFLQAPGNSPVVVDMVLEKPM